MLQKNKFIGVLEAASSSVTRPCQQCQQYRSILYSLLYCNGCNKLV